MNISWFLKFVAALVCVLLAFVSLPATVECAKKASGSSSPAAAPATPAAGHEPVIEEVTQKQLERILQEKDYVAVYWCKCIYKTSSKQPKKKKTKTKQIVIALAIKRTEWSIPSTITMQTNSWHLANGIRTANKWTIDDAKKKRIEIANPIESNPKAYRFSSEPTHKQFNLYMQFTANVCAHINWLKYV